MTPALGRVFSFIFVTVLAARASQAQAAPSPTLYVSPTGSGSACTEDAPCALGDVPAAVRALTAAQTADITVYLRGGTYRLGSTFTLGVADSGANGFKVSYTAYPGEVPIVSGAVAITGFVPSKPNPAIWVAPVPAGAHGRQLFVNGTRAQRARAAGSPSKLTLSSSTGTFTTSNPSYASFTNPTAVEVVEDNKWKHLRCPLSALARSGSGSSLKVLPACFSNNNSHVPNPGFPFNGNGLPVLDSITYVENALQLLTKPGQFYLDTTNNLLYYMPRSGETDGNGHFTADVELPLLETLVSLSGTPGHLTPANDPAATYQGTWKTSTGRKLGDYMDDVHDTQSNGASATFTFQGTGIDVLAETNADEGAFQAFVDGQQDTSRSFTEQGSTRVVQQVVYSVTGLTNGPHTVKLVKTGGTYLLVDAFVVIPDVVAPVHDLSFTGITFEGTTWNLPSSVGYIDNQAGIQWDATTHLPIRASAAFVVHRGKDITVSGNTLVHLGGDGVDFADGTQSSLASDNYVLDVSAIGIAVGEVDDYYLTDTTRMTLGNVVSSNQIWQVGQDYHDAVGIWVGHARNTLVAQNEVAQGPYTGISLGWGWGYASSCTLQTSAAPKGQGLSSCRHGTIYSGGNQILGNKVHDIMTVTHDGGDIYTLGGQGNGGGTAPSTLAGNWLVGGPNNNNMIYQDEGSSYWDTHDNVTSGKVGNWVGMWTPTIHDITIHGNYTDNTSVKNNGTNVTITGTTTVTGGNWPPAAQAIMEAAGPGSALPPPP